MQTETITEMAEFAPMRPVQTFDADCVSIDTPYATEAVSESISESFTPDTAEKVDWVLGKIADHRARAARIRENAELMARAEEREAESLEWRFGPALQDFARKELEGGKKKSVRLFNGVIGFRTRPASVSVTDPGQALSWARVNLPEAVTEGLDKRALSAALLSTGEALPFAQLIPAEDVFYVK